VTVQAEEQRISDIFLIEWASPKASTIEPGF